MSQALSRSPLAPFAIALLLTACTKDAPHDDHQDAAPAATNRIDVPEAVRQNLGITFAKVERRRVAATKRLAGYFELLPSGRGEVRAPMPGRIDVRVQLLQQVTPGQVLFALESPEWRRIQRELGELETKLAVTSTNLKSMTPLLAACELHEASLQSARTTLTKHIEVLEATQREVGGQAQVLAGARVDIAQTDAQLAEANEKHAETMARIAELTTEEKAQTERLQLAFAAAAGQLGMPVADLLAGEPALWRKLGAIEVRAAMAGVVEQLGASTGSLVDAQAPIVTVIDRQAVHCRVRALQSDLDKLRDGLPTVIVPADPHWTTPPLRAELRLATTADPLQRTLDLFALPSGPADFVRPGVAVFVEIETDGTSKPQLAIPRSAVLQDGLHRVFFRRDPNDPDKVIRVEADLGLDDGRWIEVKSGVVDGDEVVLTGAYELVLASSQQAKKGGHFHADGTFHEDGK